MALDTPPLAEVMGLLGDPKHLQREKGLHGLTDLLKGGLGAEEQIAVEAGIMELLGQQSWEKKLGGLMAAKAYVDLAQPDEPLLERLRLAAMGLLEDGEVRVRMAVGDCLKSLTRRQGIAVVEACLP
ncbi:hypothetical protein Vretifemale_16485, partial [Volvox reticuliferus]